MNFQVDYILLTAAEDHCVKTGTYNVKNQESEFSALVNLEKHLLKKHPTAAKMKVKAVRQETIFGYTNAPISDFFTRFNKKK